MISFTKKLISGLIIIFYFINVGNTQIQFTDVSLQNGIDQFCPGFCFFGVATSFVDFDDDGWDDITIGSLPGDSILFFKNVGGTLVKIPALVPDTDHTMQVLYFDQENDGDLDIFVVNRGGQNRLYLNDGQMNFSDHTALTGFPIIDDLTNSASICDYNNDGFPDIYIGNWDLNFPNYLFKNNGDSTYTDVHASVGLLNNNCLTNATGVIDINHDGWQDIYVSVDRELNETNIDQSLMFLNQGGTFIDISASSNTDLEINAMNVGPGDYDNDGDLDIWVSDDPDRSRLLRNNGDNTFTDVALDYGVEFLKFGWGGSFFDADLDMDLDLYASAMEEGTLLQNDLFINQWDQGLDTFYQLAPNFHEGDTFFSFSNSIGDLNNDGKLDIVVSNAETGNEQNPAHHFLWRNDSNISNNYLKIKLKGSQSNARGVGSWITIWTDGVRQVRYTTCGINYLSQNSYNETFGLGPHLIVDSIIVEWLSGEVSKTVNISANQLITIQESSKLFVSQNATGNATGASWENAFLDLSAAISAANNGTVKEIWVAEGTYFPAITAGRKSTFEVSNGIQLYGGFDGTESLISERDITAHATILSGDIGLLNISSDNVFHVVTILNAMNDVRLDGITIEDGNANGVSASDQKGAGLIVNGNTLLSNISVRNCSSTEPGTHIHLSNNAIKLTLENVECK